MTDCRQSALNYEFVTLCVYFRSREYLVETFETISSDAEEVEFSRNSHPAMTDTSFFGVCDKKFPAHSLGHYAYLKAACLVQDETHCSIFN